MPMDKTTETKPKKKGFFAILKDAMTKPSACCGPSCGCHVEEDKEEVQGGDAPPKGKEK
jgi:hypothetical protein